MADETQNNSATPTAPAPAVAPAPAAQAAPATQASLPLESPEPAASAKTETAIQVVPAAEPSVLGDDAPKTETKTDTKPEEKTDDKKIEAKADEKPADEKSAEGDKKPDGEKKEEASQSDEPAPLPSYDAWVFPEGVEADPAKVAAFNTLFGEFESTTKVEHAEMQKLGQKLVDFNISQMRELQQAYTDKWNQDKKDWFDSFQKDPEIGGNRAETTTRSVRQFVETFGGNDEQKTELRNFLKTTGVGNHPALIRLIANASLVKREGTPVPAQKGPAPSVSKVEKRYGKTST